MCAQVTERKMDYSCLSLALIQILIVINVCIILLQGVQPPVLIFVQSKERARELFHELIYDGMNVDVIHSDQTQEQVLNIC